MADMLALTLLSVLQLFTTNLAALLVIRIALGMAIAVEYTVGTALLMEWVPAKRYFRYQTYLLAYWAIGYFAAYLRRTLVGGLFYACQTFPFFGISIFLPILMEKMENMNVTNPLVTQLLYYALMIAGVLVGIVLSNRLPRRYFLIGTFLASAAFLLVLSIWHQAPLALTLILFSLFSLTISAALVMDYAYPNELFDASIRTSGVEMCIAISRIGAVAGTFMLPIISNAWGSQAIFIICDLRDGLVNRGDYLLPMGTRNFLALCQAQPQHH